jgi:hypothetical protein
VKFTVDLWSHPDVAWYGAAESAEVLDDFTVVIRYLGHRSSEILTAIQR